MKAEGQTQLARLERMKMAICESLKWFASQTRNVEILNVMIFRIKKFE
jgi:hypothetical protein